jgi:DNA-binding transcriptional regulator PaaX
MENKNTKKPNIQKDILKFLAEKTAVPIDNITRGEPSETSRDPKKNYAVARSVKNLVESGCVEIHNSDNKKYLKITKLGTQKLNCIKLEGEEALVSSTWDGFWRIIIIDIPENRKSERDAIRYLLKKANFVCIKNTVWISPYPYENLFTNIKKDLNLGTELMIIVTNKLDGDTSLVFLKSLEK